MYGTLNKIFVARVKMLEFLTRNVNNADLLQKEIEIWQALISDIPTTPVFRTEFLSLKGNKETFAYVPFDLLQSVVYENNDVKKEEFDVKSDAELYVLEAMTSVILTGLLMLRLATEKMSDEEKKRYTNVEAVQRYYIGLLFNLNLDLEGSDIEYFELGVPMFNPEGDAQSSIGVYYGVSHGWFLDPDADIPKETFVFVSEKSSPLKAMPEGLNLPRLCVSQE